MKTLFLLICLMANGLLMPVNAQQHMTDTPNLAMFGRGIYPGDDTTYLQLKNAGFNTIMLSSFYIHANGDVYSGDDHANPIIHNGKYTGSREWLQRVAALRQAPTAVTRIEILLEGRWYNQPPNTYDHIQDWYDSSKTVAGIVTGLGPNSTLYNICRIFKEEIGVDAVCIDDESVYNSTCIGALGEMIGQLGMRMTLCPFRKPAFWKDVICRSKPGLIDAIYLQCYDGGRNNKPGDWKKKLETDLPVYPIFLCRGAFSTCAAVHNSKTPADIKADMVSFKKDYPEMKGGAIWQLADVKSYINNNCAGKTPESGTAVSVVQYMSELKNSLQEGLE
ncbi:hypothetical protein [Chitinophaga rhizophila]|uniref:Uncharacterized protein n=1 Tax=Chitinophaga rhizophila TaxID=2866212 RepID=A0ABS7GA23_9BACT|nr:hypothetical protein [Chitinophaga rhizophila]MBW8684505.1 hypothetical protein [Chitinophaga rhizophila]